MFNETLFQNNISLYNYLEKLVNIGLGCGSWEGLPSTISQPFVERVLLTKNFITFFKDEDLGYLMLPATVKTLDVYNEPKSYTAYGFNDYTMDLTSDNSVIIYDNLSHNTSINNLYMYAKYLYEIDLIINVNLKAQKTPVLLTCDEHDRLSFENFYKDFDGNMPAIFLKNSFKIDGIKSLNLNSPYLGDKLTELKRGIWNEALSYLGVVNTAFQKRERVVQEEIYSSQGDTIAFRYSRLKSRLIGCEKIKEMFGLDITYKYNPGYTVVLGGEENS